MSASPRSACYATSANNIEKRLSSDIYDLTSSVPRLRKKSGRLYAVLETLVELKSEAYSPPAQAFNLSVPLPPPEHFAGVHLDELCGRPEERAD